MIYNVILDLMDIATYFETYSRLLNFNSRNTTISEGIFDDINDYPTLSKLLKEEEEEEDDDIYGMSYKLPLFPIENTYTNILEFINTMEIDYIEQFKFNIQQSFKRFQNIGEQLEKKGVLCEFFLGVSVDFGNKQWRDPFVNTYYTKNNLDIPVSIKLYMLDSGICIPTTISKELKTNDITNIPPNSVYKRLEIIKDVFYANIVVVDYTEEYNCSDYEFNFNINNPQSFKDKNLFIVKYGLEKEISQPAHNKILRPTIKLSNLDEKICIFDLLLCICNINFDII